MKNVGQPILPGARCFAKHVLVDILLGVAADHMDAVDLVHHVHQYAEHGYHERGVFRVVGVRQSSLASIFPSAPRPP